MVERKTEFINGELMVDIKINKKPVKLLLSISAEDPKETAIDILVDAELEEHEKEVFMEEVMLSANELRIERMKQNYKGNETRNLRTRTTKPISTRKWR